VCNVTYYVDTAKLIDIELNDDIYMQILHRIYIYNIYLNI